MGLLSDFAINLDDLETLPSIITDTCNELKIPHDDGRVVARVMDLHAQGRTRQEIIEILRASFAAPRTPDSGLRQSSGS